MRNFLSFLAIVIFVFSCKNSSEKETDTKDADADLNELYVLMQGSFNSEKQSVSDSTYYNISLHMYPIWEDQGRFLYVEQAMNSVQDKPYRQRIYKLTQLNDSVFSSAVYTIPNDSLWIGKWKTPESFNTLSPDILEERSGCAVLLKRIGENHFKGATNDADCGSTLRGASYATSTVEISANKIVSWDQGFDKDGEQVWGATEGGYVFDKLR